MCGQKVYLFILFSLLLFIPLGSNAEPIQDYGEAINQAGRQRMLSQRMVKAFAQIGQQILFANPREQLNSAIRLYQKQLNNLKSFARSVSTKQALTDAETVWKRYRRVADGVVNKENAVKLNGLSEELLQASQQVVQALVQEAGTEKAHIVDISGRQRMLSQRMAKYYLLLSWGVEDPRFHHEFNKAELEFSLALSELNDSSLNTVEINEVLGQVNKQWRFFQLTKIMDKGRYLPSVVARTTEKLLIDMNEVTGMYAKVTVM
ncbi:MAG: type IV pili methyl-accepting chemotaxis transducer N-terminal domain-containing protein [Candidatus Thiodiazotropha sp. (ex Ctena orbiculata)]|nr:type IV pili methyl-accepting chemotaxis transducer N-terminal domain-containing protein [Candidatus Thiodiazotropha taylori]MBT3036865.1 type IV pili methyl-accepting chemotaxis transducer N-terminal domain-containing protein [Candidatus Thiodiazotropha taylori]